MFDKFTAVLAVMNKGKEVSDPALWKGRQIKATVLAAFLMALVALAKAFDINIPVDNEAALALAGGFIALVNIVLTYATSAKVGVGGVVPDERAPAD